MSKWILFVVGSLLASCATSPSNPRSTLPAASASGDVLPFIADDYSRALAEAKKTRRLLFVDGWAPWCHSCQSMRAYVFTDRSLEPIANDFVWLAVDTEKPVNAPFVGKFPHEASPTLWIIDPETEKPLLKWAGTATASELKELLATVRAKNEASESTVALLRGDHALAAGDADEAKRAYREVVFSTSARASAKARAAEALIGLLSRNEPRECVDLAKRTLPSIEAGTSRASVVIYALSCASEAKLESDVAAFTDEALEMATASSATMADDRSALFEAVVDAKQAQRDRVGAAKVAATWAAFLEEQARRATTPQARAVFDPHRLLAYIALGDPGRAIPMLEASERDFPNDESPPTRLARAYFEMKRYAEATAAIERGLARSQGPRVMRASILAADIAKAKGDPAAERAALELGLARTRDAVLVPGQAKLRATLEQRLRDLR